MSNIKTVGIEQVRPNKVSLRDLQKDSEQYLALVASIQARGFVGSISTREKTDEDTGETYYEIIDGLHRWSAAKEAGKKEINITVEGMDDAEVLQMQICANLHRVDTRPVQFAQQIKRLLALQPTLTMGDIAEELGVSDTWVKKRLRLTDIENQEVAKLIDNGKIKVTNALILAQLPADEQASWVDQAIADSPEVFIPKLRTRLKEIKEARRSGRPEGPVQFQGPTPTLRKLTKLKEVNSKADEFASQFVQEFGVDNPVDAVKLMLQWVIQVDPKSAETQREKFEQRQREKEERKKRREAERKAKKAAEQKKKAEAAAAAAAKAAEDAEAAQE